MYRIKFEQTLHSTNKKLLWDFGLEWFLWDGYLTGKFSLTDPSESSSDTRTFTKLQLRELAASKIREEGQYPYWKVKAGFSEATTKGDAMPLRSVFWRQSRGVTKYLESNMAGSVFQDPGLSIPMLNMDDQTDVGMEKEGRGPTMSTGFMVCECSLWLSCSRSTIQLVYCWKVTEITWWKKGCFYRGRTHKISC